MTEAKNNTKTETDNDTKVVTVTQFTCQSCGKNVVTRLPFLRVANFPEFSSLTFAHQMPIKCKNCDTYYLPLLDNIDESMKIRLLWKKVNVKEEPQENSPEDDSLRGKPTQSQKVV
jgi:hypothetical protein